MRASTVIGCFAIFWASDAFAQNVTKETQALVWELTPSTRSVAADLWLQRASELQDAPQAYATALWRAADLAPELFPVVLLETAEVAMKTSDLPPETLETLRAINLPGAARIVALSTFAPSMLNVRFPAMMRRQRARLWRACPSGCRTPQSSHSLQCARDPMR
ncbi:MAG: hypothetical protein R3E66_12060 [bacterium]